MIVKLNDITLDVDIEKTKQYYEHMRIITDGCSCNGCCNFFLGTEKIDMEILNFFLNLGIDIQKPAEIMVCCTENSGKAIYYQGFYHICGRVLTGNDCWVAKGSDDTTSAYTICDENLYHVSKDLAVGFSNSIALFDKSAFSENEFPMPVIQMEIFFHNFPWVLGKPNTYK